MTKIKARAIRQFHVETERTDSYSVYRHDLIRDGHVVPFFKQKIQKMESATGEYAVRGEVFGSTTSMSFNGRFYNPARDLKHNSLQLLGYTIPVTGNLDLARQKAMDKVNSIEGLQSGIMALPFVKDLKKTINMLSRPFSTLQDATSNYLRRDHAIRGSIFKTKRINAAQRRSYAAAAADSWLEYQMGVKPLMLDIKNTVSEYNRVIEDRKILMINEGFTDVQRFPKAPITGVVDSPVCKYIYDAAGEGRSNVRYRGAVEIGVRSHNGGTLFAGFRGGFTLPEFLPSVWECLPYSWMADYFTNVGSVLNARANASMNTLLWMNRVEKTSVTTTVTSRFVSNGAAGRTLSFSPQAVSKTKFRLDRYIVGTWPVPEFSLRLNLGPVHQLNLAMLASSKESNRVHGLQTRR